MRPVTVSFFFQFGPLNQSVGTHVGTLVLFGAVRVPNEPPLMWGLA